MKMNEMNFINEKKNEKMLGFHYLLKSSHDCQNCTFKKAPLLNYVSKTVMKSDCRLPDEVVT